MTDSAFTWTQIATVALGCVALVGCPSAVLYGAVGALGTPDILYDYHGGSGALSSECTDPPRVLNQFRTILDSQKCALSATSGQVLRYDCRYQEGVPIGGRKCMVVENGIIWAQRLANAATYFQVLGSSSAWLECDGENYSLDTSAARSQALRNARAIQERCSP